MADDGERSQLPVQVAQSRSVCYVPPSALSLCPNTPLPTAAVCKTRIVTHEWHLATASVRKCANAFFALAKEALRPAADADAAGKAAERLRQELTAYEFAISRLDHVGRRCDEEAAEYRRLHESIDQRVGGTKEEITRLQAELEAARLRRKRRQRYEEIAVGVNKRPPRDALQA
jgi:hypothetical protein